jgi:hypothetical protein
MKSGFRKKVFSPLGVPLQQSKHTVINQPKTVTGKKYQQTIKQEVGVWLSNKIILSTRGHVFFNLRQERYTKAANINVQNLTVEN